MTCRVVRCGAVQCGEGRCDEDQATLIYRLWFDSGSFRGKILDRFFSGAILGRFRGEGKPTLDLINFFLNLDFEGKMKFQKSGPNQVSLREYGPKSAQNRPRPPPGVVF